MALTIINSPHSFIRFDESAGVPNCIWGTVDFCLPVFNESDYAFQWVIEGTAEEINSLCTADASEVQVSLIPGCDEVPFLIFTEKPQRFRLSDTQVLYNWDHGFPGFTSSVGIGHCFKVQVEILLPYTDWIFCTNCFERIADDCFTSVIEYGNDEDSFGFKYCTGGNITDPEGITCEPVVVQFVGVETLAIPYTAFLADKFGDMPTVQVWVYDGLGQLVNMGLQVTFDGYPATMINIDLGGISSGIVVIR